MASDRVEIWVQPPPIVQIEHPDAQTQNPAPELQPEKLAPDQLMALGMMLYMEQGLILEWLHPKEEKEKDEAARPLAGPHVIPPN